MHGVDTLARVLQLLALLQRQPVWTGEALAERLGVTARTVRRDIMRLRDLGYVVDAETGRAGGYRLVAGQALPPLTLADTEAVAAAIALRSASGSGVAGVEAAATTALGKLEQVLPPRLRERVAALDAATEQLTRVAAAAVDPDVLVALAHGCHRGERVRCAYTDSRGGFSRRELEPYQLVQARRRWYLAAFDRDRGEWRTLRVDRVTDVQLQGVAVPARERPDATELVAQAITVAPYRWHATVRLDAPVELAAEWVPPTVGAVSGDGDRAVLRISANDLSWLARYLAGLPVRFAVDEPPELRAALAELGAQLTAEFG